MSKLRKELLAGNATVNWIPKTIKEGRFGEWLREVKDWAISRERYWGTPLPLWQCKTCGAVRALGSISELEEAQPKARNRYIFVRHGEAESNLKDIVSCFPERLKMRLTLRGRRQADLLSRKFQKEGVDLLFASDVTRTRETAEMLGKALGVRVVFDPRLREINMGDFNGRPVGEYHRHFTSDFEKFTKQPPHGETLRMLRARLFAFIRDCERKHNKKTILVVSHEYPIWMLGSIFRGWTDEEAARAKLERGKDFIKTGSAEEMRLRIVPRDETGAMDLHRPYIDEVSFPCMKRGCRGTMRRVPEVADAWFDSGAMPFAQEHWPFDSPPARFAGASARRVGGSLRVNPSSKRKDAPPRNYPADYITEGIDQTRGWFYTLLAVASLLGFPAPYRNVISLGLTLDKNGQKMSKSKGNVIHPQEMFERYGADAVRWFFYTVNDPGEPKNFDERDLQKVLRQFILLLYNSYVFYATYAAGRVAEKAPRARHVLDRWILEKLRTLVASVTNKLERYEIGAAAREIEMFAVQDLSRWYIRRSRRRLQRPENKADYAAASATLGFVLKTVSELLAPFIPFFSEALFQSLVPGKGVSVHCTDWPKNSRGRADKKLLSLMEEIRRLAALALAKRAEAGIKVRQPLNELRIKNKELRNKNAFLEILCDEVNVKRVVFDPKLKGDLVLDTTITHELEEEGMEREFVRLVQGLRQDAGLKPRDTIALFIETEGELEHIVRTREGTIKKFARASKIEFGHPKSFTAELETKIGDSRVWIGLKRIG